jgi:hypothetical protein
VEPTEIDPGTRVLVQGCRRRATLEGLEGTIRQRLGGERYVAFEVRLDGGRRELFWPHELEEAKEKTSMRKKEQTAAFRLPQKETWVGLMMALIGVSLIVLSFVVQG